MDARQEHERPLHPRLSIPGAGLHRAATGLLGGLERRAGRPPLREGRPPQLLPELALRPVEQGSLLPISTAAWYASAARSK